MKKFFKILLIVAVVIFTYFLIQHLIVTDKEKIVKAVKTGREAIEQKDKERLIDLFSKDYEDETGLTYAQIDSIIDWSFDYFDDFDIFLTRVEVEIEKDRGEAEFGVKVIGRKEEELFLLAGTLTAFAKVKLVFKKEEKVWRAISGDLPWT